MAKVMKIAILIACHKNFEQVNLLIGALKHPQIDVYIHIDSKADYDGGIKESGGVYIIPKRDSINVKWAHFSQVEATLKLMNYASIHDKYGYYCFISGEDWPCCNLEEILGLLSKQKNRISFWESRNHNGTFNNLDKRVSLYFPKWMIERTFFKRLIRRLYIAITGGYNRTFRFFHRKTLNCKFYHGASWWGLTGETVEWIIDYLQKNPQYINFYRNCLNPDESFFQTLVMLSPWADDTTDFLTYVRFLEGANSPEYLGFKEMQQAYQSKYCFMRKIDLKKLSEVERKLLLSYWHP